MDDIERAQWSARVSVLEEMVALLIASQITRDGGNIETLRTTLWQMLPASDLPADDPRVLAWRQVWEIHLDRLMDRAAVYLQPKPR